MGKSETEEKEALSNAPIFRVKTKMRCARPRSNSRRQRVRSSLSKLSGSFLDRPLAAVCVSFFSNTSKNSPDAISASLLPRCLQAIHRCATLFGMPSQSMREWHGQPSPHSMMSRMIPSTASRMSKDARKHRILLGRINDVHCDRGRMVSALASLLHVPFFVPE